MYRTFVTVILILSAWTSCIAAGGAGAASAGGTDTVSLTLPGAEQRFLKNNLALIAQRYQISQAQAGIITARLFNNPDFSIANVLYNPVTKKYFDMSRDGGEYSAQLSQLFLTAGKRNKNIELAKITAQQAYFQFYDLLRTLRFTLRSDYYKLYFQRRSVMLYQQEINSLTTILAVFKEQFAKGNIAQKEVLRIQSQLYALQAEQNELRAEIDDTESEFKLLVRMPPAEIVKLESAPEGKTNLTEVPYQRLLDSAMANRNDLKLARSVVDYSNINLKLQKAMAVPDITASLAYDKQGSYVRNYNSAGIAFSLPFFNRNQGAIEQARIAVEAGKTQLQSQQDQLESDLANGYKGALRLADLYQSFDPGFRNDFEHLIGEVAKNFQKHNITLLEFLDFYDSYKTNSLQLNALQLERITSLEQLNFITGTQIFNQ